MLDGKNAKTIMLFLASAFEAGFQLKYIHLKHLKEHYSGPESEVIWRLKNR